MHIRFIQFIEFLNTDKAGIPAKQIDVIRRLYNPFSMSAFYTP